MKTQALWIRRAFAEARIHSSYARQSVVRALHTQPALWSLPVSILQAVESRLQECTDSDTLCGEESRIASGPSLDVLQWKTEEPEVSMEHTKKKWLEVGYHRGRPCPLSLLFLFFSHCMQPVLRRSFIDALASQMTLLVNVL